MGDRGLAGKWSHYEQSLRVPLIIHDPRMEKAARGRVPELMALNIDIPATLLELAGVAVPEHYQGRSLVPAFTDAAIPDWRRDFLCEHLMDHPKIPKWEGVRGERFVYARYFEQQPAYEFLHDLEADPDQLVNLAGDPAHGETLARMQARCDELIAGNTIPAMLDTTTDTLEGHRISKQQTFKKNTAAEPTADRHRRPRREQYSASP